MNKRSWYIFAQDFVSVLVGPFSSQDAAEDHRDLMATRGDAIQLVLPTGPILDLLVDTWRPEAWTPDRDLTWNHEDETQPPELTEEMERLAETIGTRTEQMARYYGEFMYGGVCRYEQLGNGRWFVVPTEGRKSCFKAGGRLKRPAMNGLILIVG